MKYRVRVVVDSIKGGQHAETMLGTVEASSLADVVKKVSRFKLGHESADEMHNRLVGIQNGIKVIEESLEKEVQNGGTATN